MVGTLRKTNYQGDLVLGISVPIDKTKRGVKSYIKENDDLIVAYNFELVCKAKDLCQLNANFLGYSDPRPPRSLASIKYSLYEYWLMHYNESSYILIVDFRDTFFQLNPFEKYSSNSQNIPESNLFLFAENSIVSIF